MTEANRRTKILILTGNYGDGHVQAAIAIREAARVYCPKTEVEVTDFMEWAHPRWNGVSRFLYIHGVKTFPSVYGYIFHKTRRQGSLSEALKKIKLFDLEKTLQYINEVKPSVIVSTFPVAATAVALLKESGLLHVPVVTVITDHTDHSYWLNPGTDRYIVGSERVQDALMATGIPAAQISVTGIPVRPPFWSPLHKEAMMRKLGFDATQPTVLVMGGGYGIIGKEMADIVKQAAATENARFIIVCGRNQKLQKRLAEQFSLYRNRVTITGYVNNIHELMAISDLIITKPGGLTTTEAVAMERPLLLTGTLPGQEQDNADFLCQAGVAVRADESADIAELLSNLLHRPDHLAKMRYNAGKMGMNRSAIRALRAILNSCLPQHDASVKC